MNFEFEKYLNRTAARNGSTVGYTLEDLVIYGVRRQIGLSQCGEGFFDDDYMNPIFEATHLKGRDDVKLRALGLYNHVQKLLKYSKPFESVMFASTMSEYHENVERARIYRHEDFRLPMSFTDHLCGNGNRMLATLAYVTANYGRDALLNKEIVISDINSLHVCLTLFQILQHAHHHKIPIGKITAKWEQLEEPHLYSCVARKPAQSVIQIEPIEMAVDRLLAA